MYLADNGRIQVPVTLNDQNAGYTSIWARINGCWTKSFRAPIDVTEPWTEPEDLVLISMTESISLGEPLYFYVEKWDEADYYTYSISFDSASDGVPIIYENLMVPYEETFTPDGYGTGIIPGYYFTMPGNWTIFVNAYRESDGEMRSVYHSVVVRPAEDNKPAPPVVTYAPAHPKAFETVSFSISSLNGAEKLALYVRPGADRYYRAVGSVYNLSEGQTSFIYSFDPLTYGGYSFETDYLVQAAVCIDGVWSEYSEPLLMRYEVTGHLSFGEDYWRVITVSPAEPAVGDIVTVSWPAVAGADWYDVYFNGILVAGHVTGTSAACDTSSLEAGGYSCYVYPFAYGKTNDCGYAEFRLRNSAWKPVLTAGKTRLTPGEATAVTVTSAGGSEVNIYINSELYGKLKRESGAQQITLSFPNEGIYVVTAESEGDSRSERSALSDPLVFIVLRPGSEEKEFVLPSSLVRIEDEAFSGLRNVIIHVSNKVTYISPTAFDASVVIMAPAGSYAETVCREYGLTVLNP